MSCARKKDYHLLSGLGHSRPPCVRPSGTAGPLGFELWGAQHLRGLQGGLGTELKSHGGKSGTVSSPGIPECGWPDTGRVFGGSSGTSPRAHTSPGLRQPLLEGISGGGHDCPAPLVAGTLCSEQDEPRGSAGTAGLLPARCCCHKAEIETGLLAPRHKTRDLPEPPALCRGRGQPRWGPRVS